MNLQTGKFTMLFFIPLAISLSGAFMALGQSTYCSNPPSRPPPTIAGPYIPAQAPITGYPFQEIQQEQQQRQQQQQRQLQRAQEISGWEQMRFLRVRLQAQEDADRARP